MGFWLEFFRDAGIPSSIAMNYAATFEDNRISKEMLLDLDKDILMDMGIKVMGDVIAILKHAKKVHNQDSRKRERSSAHQPSTDDQGADNIAVSTTVQHPKPSQDVTSVGGGGGGGVSGVDARTNASTSSSSGSVVLKVEKLRKQRSSPVSPPPPPLHPPHPPAVADLIGGDGYGSLESDRLLVDTRRKRKLDSTSAPRHQVEAEEYTTATYENRLLRKRMYSDEMAEKLSPPRQLKVVVLPPPPPPPSSEPLQEDDRSVSVSVRTLPPSSVAARSNYSASQRLLQAAGVYQTEDSSPILSAKESVFSRLGVTDAPADAPTIRAVKRSVSAASAARSDKPGGVRKVLSAVDASSGGKASRKVVSRRTKPISVLPSMVADEIELNSSSQTDVHSRLQGRGSARNKKTALQKRLGDPFVFRRLE